MVPNRLAWSRWLSMVCRMARAASNRGESIATSSPGWKEKDNWRGTLSIGELSFDGATCFLLKKLSKVSCFTPSARPSGTSGSEFSWMPSPMPQNLPSLEALGELPLLDDEVDLLSDPEELSILMLKFGFLFPSCC